MIKLFWVFLIMLTTSPCWAFESLPCEPTLETNRATLFCEIPQKSYIIHITKLVSPKECPKADSKKILSARIILKNHATKEISETEMEGSEFTWGLERNLAWFISESNNLELTDCTSPSTGGFSIGN